MRYKHKWLKMILPARERNKFVGWCVFRPPAKALFKCYLLFNVLLKLHFQVVVIILINQQNQLLM